MPYKYFLFLIIYFVVSQISAQNHNTIDLNISYKSAYLKDVNFSPLNYSHSGLLYGFDYKKEKKKKRFIVSVDYYNSMLKTDASTLFESDLTIVNFKASYQWAVNTKNQRMHLYLGGELHTNVNYINYNDKDAYSFLAAYSLNLKPSIIYNFNDKYSICTSISIPLITLLVQPPYNGFDEQLEENEDKPLKLLTDGDITLPNKYFSFNWNVKYTFKISKKISPFVKYQFNYQQASKSHSFKQVINQVTLGLNYKF